MLEMNCYEKASDNLSALYSAMFEDEVNIDTIITNIITAIVDLHPVEKSLRKYQSARWTYDKNAAYITSLKVKKLKNRQVQITISYSDDPLKILHLEQCEQIAYGTTAQLLEKSLEKIF